MAEIFAYGDDDEDSSDWDIVSEPGPYDGVTCISIANSSITVSEAPSGYLDWDLASDPGSRHHSYLDALVKGAPAATEVFIDQDKKPQTPKKEKKKKRKGKAADRVKYDYDYDTPIEERIEEATTTTDMVALMPRGYMKGDPSLGYRRSAGSATRTFCRCSGCSRQLARMRAGEVKDYGQQEEGGIMASREYQLHAALYVQPKGKAKELHYPKNLKHKTRKATKDMATQEERF